MSSLSPALYFCLLSSLLVALSPLPGSGPAPAEAFFFDVLDGFFEAILDVKDAIGLGDLADDIRERRRRNKKRRRRRNKKKGKRRRRRYKKRFGRSVPGSSEFAPVDPELMEDFYEEEETVEDILERAAMVDYGDCAKKLICDLASKYSEPAFASDETDSAILALFYSVKENPGVVDLDLGPAVQLQMAAALGWGVVGENPANVTATPKRTDGRCSAVYARCPLGGTHLAEIAREMEPPPEHTGETSGERVLEQVLSQQMVPPPPPPTTTNQV